MKSMRALGLAAMMSICGGGGALAAPAGYPDQGAFDAATAALSSRQTVDFESVASGTVFASGAGTGGLSFSYAIAGKSIQVSSTFSTTSGSNYLGLDNPDTAFFLGDSFTIEFNRTVHAVGLYLITGTDTQPGDLELSAGGASVFNDGSFIRLADGGQAYYLGLVETDPTLGFTTATVQGIVSPGAFVAFTADDITSAVAGVPAVPEPSSWAIMLAGLGVFAWGSRRIQRREMPQSPSHPLPESLT